MRTPLEIVLAQHGWERPRHRRTDWKPPESDEEPPFHGIGRCIDPKGQDRMRLVRFAAGDLPPAEREQCKAHLDACRGCQDYLSRVQAVGLIDRFLQLAETEARRRQRRPDK